ncbi:cullin-2-like isoform X2 [Dysidea avara]|uniref:cullin-2-like isoform X2 n=1 Tax=Dysidea avara TaxID=196820 RepID=UPI00332DC8C5
MSLRPKQIDFEETWQRIRVTVNNVVSVQPVTNKDWNDCFSDIYSLCVSYPDCHLERLYHNTCDLLTDHVRSLRTILQCEGQSLLHHYGNLWDNYDIGALYLNFLYSYYNRESHNHEHLLLPVATELIQPVELNDGVHLMEINQLAMKVWRDEMVDHVISSVVQAALHEVKKQWSNNEHDSSLHLVMKLQNSLVKMEEAQKQSSPLQLYQDNMEVPLLHLISAHCQQYAANLLAQDNYSSYLLKAAIKLNEMTERYNHVFHSSTRTKLAAMCEQRLVADQLEYLHSGINNIVCNEMSSDLTNLYQLLHHDQRALDPLVTAFEEHVKSKGIAAVISCLDNKSQDVSANFVSSVLTIHSHYLVMVNKEFGGHCFFQTALDRACRAFVNLRLSPTQPPRAPFILSRYCDHAFRKGVRSSHDPDGNWLNDAIFVFKFIDDKDMFQKCYSKALAKRLVYGLSHSNEAEENMIQRLRSVCGCQYICRLQRMILDISLSADIMEKFNTHLKSTDSKLDIAFSALVLQSGSWPLTSANQPIPMATELTMPLQIFEKFYEGQFSGKSLTWVMGVSSGELRITYLEKPYTLCVSAHHMSILLAFNTSTCHSISFLMEHTNLEEAELIRIVQLLVDNKLLSLIDGESLSSSSQLNLNMNYSNKRTKFKITTFDSHETCQELEQTQNIVDADRKLFLQASIVRVMKARKVLQHNLLVQEVIKMTALHFSPSIAMIKSVIEALIDKQYISRSDGTLNEYHYLA